jgi:hypothetical protein
MHLLALPAGALPPPLDFYPEMAGAALLEVLSARARLVPFNLAATLVFLLAVGHTFVTRLFMSLAHEIQERSDARAQAAGREPAPSVAAELVHFVGEVEVVFGLWAVVLVAVIVAFYDWPTAVAYLDGGVAFTEALFVVVIMALASSQPILALAERTLARVAALGCGTPAAWWLTILTLAPLLGSLITEPAAMTIGAQLLARQFCNLRPSPLLAYATLGALFVNISVGGTLTHFAAPPVIMVARPWGWDAPFMLSHFGGKAVLGILAVNALTFLVFRRERRRLADRATQAHHPPLFLAGFLFFLGFARATAAHQGSLDLKPPLLVGFFLASLVVHGGLQGWWIAPILAKLDAGPLFLGAALLTAFNDNALVTYLATLVPGLSDAGRYAIVAGAVTGGGLTVIANAPNPAGQSILSRSFEGGIAPLGLLAGATLPTLVFAAIFMLWR